MKRALIITALMIALAAVTTCKGADAAEAKAMAIYAPQPQYPYEARARNVTGRGAVEVTIRFARLVSSRALE